MSEGHCIECNREFTEEDYSNASEGKESLVGDYDNICYPCQFKLMDDGTFSEWKAINN